MTAPKYDLTACVEAGAKALYDDGQKGLLPGRHRGEWHTADPLTKLSHREVVLPVVRAVLAVVEAGE